MLPRPLLAAAAMAALAGAASAALPFTLDDHMDLRPGAPILPDEWLTVYTLHGSTRNLTCTANFLFHDATGHRYLGTAGHCAPVGQGVFTWPWPEGPVALDAAWQPFGRFVYAGNVLSASNLPPPLPGLDRYPIWDMALIRLDEGIEASPQMAHFGGPVGLNEDLTLLPVVLHEYGWGVHGVNLPEAGEGCCALEQPFHGRTFVATGMPDPDRVNYNGVQGGGDSGSPVISGDGRAVGIVSSMNYLHHTLGPEGHNVGISTLVRLGPQLAMAEQALGLDLTLETAPLL